MKNLFLGLFVVLVMISCSSDEHGMTTVDSQGDSAEGSSVKQLGPSNVSNAYDEIGKRYGSWLTDYYQVHGYSKTIFDLTNQVNYMGVKLKMRDVLGKSSLLVTEDNMTVSVTNPENSVITALATSALSEAVKSNLLGFFVALIQNKDSKYSLLYDFIVTYEANISDSTSLTIHEVETILGITSVTRYALHAEGKHKDRDWEISVGNKKVVSGFQPFKASLFSVIVHLRFFL